MGREFGLLTMGGPELSEAAIGAVGGEFTGGNCSEGLPSGHDPLLLFLVVG